jgi:hypothetical protein
MKVHCRFAPGVRLSKLTSLSPGSKPLVAPVVAPRILKLPVPPEKVQAILVSAQPGFGNSNTLKMGPHPTGFEMLWPSFKVMPCSPDQAELKLNPVPPAGFVFLVMVMVQAGGVGELVKVH